MSLHLSVHFFFFLVRHHRQQPEGHTAPEAKASPESKGGTRSPPKCSEGAKRPRQRRRRSLGVLSPFLFFCCCWRCGKRKNRRGYHPPCFSFFLCCKVANARTAGVVKPQASGEKVPPALPFWVGKKNVNQPKTLPLPCAQEVPIFFPFSGPCSMGFGGNPNL